MRPIDADKLKEIYCADCDNKHLCTESPACDDVRVLYSMPTIEVLKIVREIIKIIRTEEYPEDVEDEIIKLFIKVGIFENESIKQIE